MLPAIVLGAALIVSAAVADSETNTGELGVRSVIAKWNHAWITGDGEAYCRPLTPHARKLVERYLVGGAGQCEEIFERAYRRRAQATPKGAVRIGIDGNFAIALNKLTCRRCTGFEMVLSLKRLRGKWRIHYSLPGYPPFSTLPSGGPGVADATEIAVRYVRAEHELDGATACALLTPRSRNQLDRNFNRGCIWLYEHSSVEDARVREVHVVGDVALANVKPTNDNFTHQIFMLVETSEGWRVERINPGLP
jgi:hypothetical protein